MQTDPAPVRVLEPLSPAAVKALSDQEIVARLGELTVLEKKEIQKLYREGKLRKLPDFD